MSRGDGPGAAVGAGLSASAARDRPLYAALARGTTATARTTTLIAFGALTTAAFAAVPGPYALLIAVSVAAGMVRGNLTLLQATAIPDRWGTTHYGRLSGLLAAPAHTAAALAPSRWPPRSSHRGQPSALYAADPHDSDNSRDHSAE